MVTAPFGANEKLGGLAVPSDQIREPVNVRSSATRRGVSPALSSVAQTDAPRAPLAAQCRSLQLAKRDWFRQRDRIHQDQRPASIRRPCVNGITQTGPLSSRDCL